jgi:hypothetical protein
MFLLTGCPQHIEVPLDANEEVPAWLAGTWCKVNSQGQKDKTGCYYLEKDKKKGIMTRYESDGTTAALLTGQQVVMTRVGDKTYLFVYEKGDGIDEEGYYLFALRKISNTEFELRGVKEHSMAFDASKSTIEQYLREHANDDKLFDPAETVRYVKN